MMAEAIPSETTNRFDPVRLIDQHQAGIWRYLRALGCESALAEDLTQETFLTVLKKPFDDYNPSATASYLRRVAHNLFISVQRRAGKVLAVENVEKLDHAWSRWVGDDSGEELLEALRDCLPSLTQRARQALDLRFQKKETRQNIGAALGITEHGAKNLMQRAKKQLQNCIEGKLK